MARFVNWYNKEHRHSAIRFVTPDQRHFHHEVQILEKRTALYENAKWAKPERWSTTIRNWTPIESVVLNPNPSARADAA